MTETTRNRLDVAAIVLRAAADDILNGPLTKKQRSAVGRIAGVTEALDAAVRTIPPPFVQILIGGIGTPYNVVGLSTTGVVWYYSETARQWRLLKDGE